jgi:cytochrome c peroxidase
MRNFHLILVLAVTTAGLAACGEDPIPDGFSEAEWRVIASLSRPTTLPPDFTNPFAENAEAAVLGQQLFFDRGLANWGDGGVSAPARPVVSPDGGLAEVACSDCHDPHAYFSDPRPQRTTSQGVRWTGRNSPGLVDTALYSNWSLDGRGETLSNQAIIAYAAPATMAGTELSLARALLARYADRYQRVFVLPVPPQMADPFAGYENPNEMQRIQLQAVMRNAAWAWGAYLRRLQSGTSPFDAYARGEVGALTPAQKRGLKLFLGKAGCIECHNGPNFSDSASGRFHNLGLRQTGPSMEDSGRYKALTELRQSPFAYQINPPPVATEADVGAFRTRSLRNVAQTAPYFHAGQYETLRDVIWFYNRGGDRSGVGTPSRFMVPLGLTEDDAADLEAFLHSLTGALPLTGLLCDNSRLPGNEYLCPIMGAP